MTLGRPSSYRDEYSEQVFKLCLLGATDQEIADFFGVCIATVYNWKNDYPAFLDAQKRGKVKADAHLAHKLYSRAEGAEWEEQQAIKVKISQYEERVEIVTLKRAAPPDSTALIFWLHNRHPDKWKMRSAVEHTIHTHASAAGDEALAIIALRGSGAVAPPERDQEEP